MIERNRRNERKGTGAEVVVNRNKTVNQNISNPRTPSEKFDELDNSVFADLSSDQLNPPKPPKKPKTPKPNTKETKMVSSSNPQKQADVDSPVSDKLETLIKVQDLKIGQEGMKRMFEYKLDKLKTDLITSVDNKIRTLCDEISLDLARETNPNDQIINNIQSIQSRIDNSKNKENRSTLTY
ncbi:Hypothetical predicted protein [Mytilus galloprovincialis]|uniref:Uncharacterized protein n=1 Tax=Mytilus galloprovincialis TaxID=29158 RepID=A0A8B6H3D4_MYTGA|nr:Hypothetical predicted protein [Mytilus galloprovincialis]